MFSNFYGDLLAGLALIGAALLTGRWLIGLARRRPGSMLVNEGIIADIVCVGEVVLLIGGAGLLIRGFMEMV